MAATAPTFKPGTDGADDLDDFAVGEWEEGEDAASMLGPFDADRMPWAHGLERPPADVVGPNGLEFEFYQHDDGVIEPASSRSVHHANTQIVMGSAGVMEEHMVGSGVVFQSDVDKIIQLPHRLRMWALWLLKRRFFDPIVLSVILFNCVMLGLDEPGVEPGSTRGRAISVCSK